MGDTPAKFSLSLGQKKPAILPRPTKRPHSTLDTSDDEEETVQTETILLFGDDLNKSKNEKKSLIIPAQKNRDWREESQRKRQRSGLPAAAQNEVDAEGKDNEGVKGMPASFGLTVMQRKSVDVEMADGQGTANGDSEPVKERTIDEEAMARLLGEKAQSTLVVPAVTEDEALQMDANEAPDMASLDAYAAMPIEEFGSALLRGMGWKEGEAIGRKKGEAEAKPRVVQRRAALLGIGAKEDAAVGVEMGAWGKGARGKNPTRQEYTPVIMKNAKTGETLTEKELQDKIIQQKMIESDRVLDVKQRSSDRDSGHRSDKSSRRQKYVEYDDRDKEMRRDRSRDRDRDRNRDSYKHRSSRRERSSSVDSRDHRRRRDRSSSVDSRDQRRRRDDDRDDRRDKIRRHRHRDRSYDRGSSRRDR